MPEKKSRRGDENVSYAKSFWPIREGDKECPRCGSELFITDIFMTCSDRGDTARKLYKLRCFECGDEFLIGDSLATGMKLQLRELQRGKL